MSKDTAQSQMPAYSEAVKSGLYAKKTGLTGKYDNVRRYWEDEITRSFLYPYIRRLVERCRAEPRRLRVLDLGCGSADGFELLNGIRDRDADLDEVEIDLLPPEILGSYCGVDLNEDLLKQAQSIFQHDPRLTFVQGDFTQGLPPEAGEEPYDLYFTSYGTCSHNVEDETLVRLLADIAKSTEDYALIICDWLGRFSYEWQTLWTNDTSENRVMDYVVSYIYEKEEREEKRDQLQHLNLRLMSRPEVDKVIDAAAKEAGVQITPLKFFDRSVFTGRHMDTADYNPHAQAIRLAVNNLHEAHMRTDLGSLIVNYAPKQGFDFINAYYERTAAAWNALVKYTENLLQSYDEYRERFEEEPPPILASYPQPLQQAMARIKKLLEGVGWLTTGRPRENIIEPQLGYALRHLVMNMQDGRGCGHGLIGIFEVDKSQ